MLVEEVILTNLDKINHYNIILKYVVFHTFTFLLIVHSSFMIYIATPIGCPCVVTHVGYCMSHDWGDWGHS